MWERCKLQGTALKLEGTQGAQNHNIILEAKL